MTLERGGKQIVRVHGPFVSDGEVEAVVKFLKTQGEPSYLDAITEEPDEPEQGLLMDGEGEGSGDDLYDQAVAVVARDWLAGKLELTSEAFGLKRARVEVVVVVEADLAVRHHLAVVRQFPEFIIPIGGDVFDFVGMDADRRIDEGVLVGENNG